jgi:HPt (histidine-containing phosphotransfer) domain-containing protein
LPRSPAVATALAAGAAPGIERAAHAFKSASATIGAKSPATLLQQLETAGKAGDVTEHAGWATGWSAKAMR